MTEMNADLDMVKASRAIKLHITLRRQREQGFRFRVAVYLIRLAAWIANCDVEVRSEFRA